MNLPADRPNLDVLLDRALQTGGETDAFDFKEQLDYRANGEHKLRLLKAIGAFGNTDNGGHIIIGVSDDRQIVGISPALAETYDQTPVQRMVAEYFAPPPAVQVRQHEREGKRLVIIEVAPFRDFPSIVKKYEVQGREKLQGGTFLVRNSAAESALLTSEAEVRKLCDAIATRRARSIVELIQRGTVGLPRGDSQTPAPPVFDSLETIRRRAEAYWSSAEGALPYLEASFAPEHTLHLRGSDVREVLRLATIPINHRYPFLEVMTGTVETQTAWGWLGVIPFHEEPNHEHPPTYLWLLERSGAFIYREKLWEDTSDHLKGTVAIFHVIGEVVLLLRFLDRLMRRLGIAEETKFRVGVAINHTKGRYLTNERMGFPDEYASTLEPRVEASLEATLGAIRGAREDCAINLLEEIVWQFRRQDWSRQDLVTMLRRAPQLMGSQYAFPAEET